MATRAEVEAEIQETLGLVPSMFEAVPDYLLESEWKSFKRLTLSETAIPNKYKELIGLGIAGATRCRYCAYYHAEAARLFGATEEEVTEAALMAKNSMGWSTYLNRIQVDYESFTAELDAIVGYVKARTAEPAGV